jgi:hypothetical protein
MVENVEWLRLGQLYNGANMYCYVVIYSLEPFKLPSYLEYYPFYRYLAYVLVYILGGTVRRGII